MGVVNGFNIILITFHILNLSANYHIDIHILILVVHILKLNCYFKKKVL